jgi:predicted dehydrogenase
MIKIGFLGCGGFARRYHVPALIDSADARIAVICDPQPVPALQALAAQSGAALVSDVDALLAPGACDAVIVSTPHTLHYAHTRKVLEAGRHALVDKPFVMRAREAEELAALAASRRLVAGVAFNRRLDRGCLRARELIASGALGAVRFVETVQLGYEKAGWFLDPALGGGGPFTGRASHMADLVPWLVAKPPQAVRARVRQGAPGRSDHGGFIDVRFDGVECRITCIDEGLHMWDEARIFGEEGMIELRRPLAFPIGWTFTWMRERGRVIEEIAADDTPGGCTRDFVAAVAARRDPVCSFRDAAPSVAIVESAFASAAQDERWVAL